MKILILAAMEKELKLMLSIMPGYKEYYEDGVTYFSGVFGEKEIIVAKCGIGKVNAAINSFRIIESVCPDLVINSGVAGGASENIRVGDILIAEKIAYHDVWCGPGTTYGAADGFAPFFVAAPEMLDKIEKRLPEAKYGLICSGDKFIHTVDEIREIRSHFPNVMAVDMESAAIAQACKICGVPLLIVRVMSDTPGKGDNVKQYENFWEKAPEKTFECVKDIISNIL